MKPSNGTSTHKGEQSCGTVLEIHPLVSRSGQIRRMHKCTITEELLLQLCLAHCKQARQQKTRYSKSTFFCGCTHDMTDYNNVVNNDRVCSKLRHCSLEIKILRFIISKTMKNMKPTCNFEIDNRQPRFHPTSPTAINLPFLTERRFNPLSHNATFWWTKDI